MNVAINSAQKRGRRPESHNVACVALVAMPTSCSAMLFNDGGYGTDVMMRMLCSSHICLIPLAVSSFRLLNMTVLTLLSVLFSIRFTHFWNSTGDICSSTPDHSTSLPFDFPTLLG